jgi:hypothetical protein
MNNLDTAIFYTCGTCNLKCRYCGIHKSSVLKQIDEVLEKSFEGDYYFNRVKEFFPRKDMLTSFETWGGEPFAKMERFHPTLRKLIEYYPYLNSGYSSTNFSYLEWTNKFFGLMDVFGEYSYSSEDQKIKDEYEEFLKIYYAWINAGKPDGEYVKWKKY